MEKMYGFTSTKVAPGLWGGYSEYVYLDPQALIHRLADAVPTESAANTTAPAAAAVRMLVDFMNGSFIERPVFRLLFRCHPPLSCHRHDIRQIPHGVSDPETGGYPAA